MFEAELVAKGHAVHTTSREYSVEPRRPLKAPPDVQILVYDPAKTLSRSLRQGGLPVKSLKSLEELATVEPGSDLLVIAPRAFVRRKAQTALTQVGLEMPGADHLLAFLRSGGRALVLEQDTLDGLPLGVTLVAHASTMTFPLDLYHPVLAGLTPDDLKFWRGDHYVTRMEVRRPAGNGGRAITVSGGSQALDQAPLVELPAGRGVAVLIQALVGEKLRTEPAAKKVFENALDYLASYRRPSGNTVVLSEDAAFKERLHSLGVEFTVHTRPVKKDDLAGTRLLILHGGGRTIRQSAGVIKDFLHNGAPPKTVYWHAPAPETFAAVQRVLEAGKLKIVPSQGPVMVRTPGHEVLAGVAREDLAFRGKPRGPSWMRATDPDPTVIDRALAPVMPSGGTFRLKAKHMKLDGKSVRLSEAGDVVEFYTNGSATGSLEVPEGGMYVLTLVAGGTPHTGGWPLVAIKINDRPAAQVNLTGSTIRSYPFLVDLPKGRSTVRLSFINDAYGSGEDRNLFLDALVVSKTPLKKTGVEILTLPAAVSVIPVGTGRVVVDGVRWDTNVGNRVKADRYASVLLGNLGAAFQPPHGVVTWVPARLFDIDERFNQVNKQAGEIQFYSYGEATARFECVRAGGYAVYVRGHSSPAEGVYAKVEVSVDGEPVGEVEVPASSDQDFRVGIAKLSPGEHTVMVKFTNDRHAPPEDRNLFINAVGFLRED